MEVKFKDTIKNSKRMKETLNALFSGTTNIQTQHERYNNNMDFIPKNGLALLEPNGGNLQKFSALPLDYNPLV